MKIHEVELPKELREALEKLAEKITGASDKADANQTFKAELGLLVGTAIEENDIDPVDVVRHLMVMAAITLGACCDVREGRDPRKAFRKLSGMAYDIAEQIKDRVEAKSK